MFVTLNSAESPLRFGEARVWHWVELELNAPVFFTHVEQETSEGILTRTLLTISRKDLLYWARGEENIRLQSVDLITPGYVNGSGDWRMHRLRELWVTESDLSQERYVMHDGTVFEKFKRQKRTKVAWELKLEC